MTERLKQIWGGFEKTTTRRLTGSGVERIAVPHRQDFVASMPAEFAAGVPAPAEAAFAALKARLSARGARRARGETGAFAEAPPPPLSAAAGEEGAPEAARDLIRGLKATEARVQRRYADYGAGAAGAKKRKLFGIF